MCEVMQKMVQNPEIQKLIDQIVELVDPIEIILFGSYARGDPGPDSDIDLMVVMPDGTHCRNTMGDLYSKLSLVKVEFDILVTTPGILHKHRNNIGLIYYYALKDGRIIYEKEKTVARIG